MQNFDKIEKDIKETINYYLDQKAKYELTIDNRGQKFWRNRMLVHIDTWNRINKKSDPKYTLKYMPEKFVRNPLGYRFTKQSEHYSKYLDWELDYALYLMNICKEPEEGIFERLRR